MSPHVSPQQGPTPTFSAATAGSITTVQTVSAAANTLPTIPTRERYSKSPQESRVTVHIEQYLLCSAAQLASFSSPTVTASWLTSSKLPPVSLGAKPTVETCIDTTAKLRPQASFLALRVAGANQLLRPASTTPRSYGRRRETAWAQ